MRGPSLHTPNPLHVCHPALVVVCPASRLATRSLTATIALTPTRTCAPPLLTSSMVPAASTSSKHAHSHIHSHAQAGPSQLSSDASVSAALRKAILRIFTRKHGLQLHSSSLSFIQSSLAAHDLLDKPEEWTDALEALAKGVDDLTDLEVAGASGALPSVVTPQVLEAVYERLVVADSVTDATDAANRGIANGAHDLVAGELADPQRHFHIIDAFHVPRWNWSHGRWER